jgi:pyruvate-ferredoxin/flavodoxin oxidoreductase
LLLKKLNNDIGDTLVNNIITNDESTELGIRLQHEYIAELNKKLSGIQTDDAKRLSILSENLIKKSIWIIGGDGWAYDIGYGGLDHILSTGEKLNVLVLDTEVYSNTGGQTSKSTPIGAIAKYSASGKRTIKKNLGQIAITNGNVYVAQIALGANDTQTLRAIKEAEAYPGTSLIVAYSHCIAHGFDLGHGAEQQSNAVKSGYWPLYRFNPLNPPGKRFSLDSKEPSISLKDYMYKEGRYSVLQRQNPLMADELLHKAEEYVKEKWDSLKILSTL